MKPLQTRHQQIFHTRPKHHQSPRINQGKLQKEISCFDHDDFSDAHHQHTLTTTDIKPSSWRTWCKWRMSLPRFPTSRSSSYGSSVSNQQASCVDWSSQNKQHGMSTIWNRLSESFPAEASLDEISQDRSRLFYSVMDHTPTRKGNYRLFHPSPLYIDTKKICLWVALFSWDENYCS
jgi:hypothetical protein